MKLSTPRIKICGITRQEDAALARDQGVDAIGLVFYAASPRAVSPAQARQIVRVAGPFVSATGLFVNADASAVLAVLQEVPLQILQFHGDEPAGFCEQFHRPWIKAIRVKPGIDLVALLNEYRNASAVLFDTYKSGIQGGTGEIFDWNTVTRERLPAGCDIPVILAGGLNADNVAEAIRCVQPYAVDVSGGVESVPGKKDAQKIFAFVKSVRRSYES